LNIEADVALPQLTDEQRAAALEKAAAARRARAQLKERLKRGGTTLKQVLADAENDEAVAKLKVSGSALLGVVARCRQGPRGGPDGTVRDRARPPRSRAW
jgi:cytosine/adenosine deaminase-related metal-dependent hydrolase